MDSTIWNDFQFRDDDIIIGTWSKSGTTWLQQIVSQLLFEGDYPSPAVLRLVWRRISPPPALPDGMKDWERRAARTSHALLYGILFVQPTIGILHSWAADFPIVIYGQVSLPNPMSADKSLQDALNLAHRWLGWSLVGLIALHAAAALKHHLIDRDDVLRRMVPGLKVRGG